MSDHVGRRHTIVLGAFAAALFTMLLYAAGSLPQIIACTVLTGLANGTYHPASSALLADLILPERRVRAYAAIRMAANAFGAAMGGFLASYSLFWLFAGDALTTAIYGLIALTALPQGLRGQTIQAPWQAALGYLRRDRAFHALFIAAFCSALIFAQFGSTYSLHVMRAGLGFDFLGARFRGEAVYGLLIGWNGVMVVLCELPLTGWTQRFEPRRVMAFGYLLLGGGFALNALAPALPALFVAMTIFTLGEVISAPVSSAYLAKLAPEPMRGRYMGALGLAWNGAAIIGPQVGFHLFAWEPDSLWMMCGLLGAAGAFTLLRLGKTGPAWARAPTPRDADAVPDRT